MSFIIEIDRLEFIAINNLELAQKIHCFLETHLEFQPYRQIAPATDKNILLNKEWEPKTIFEHVIYYACASGVNVNYANEQFKDIVSFLRSGNDTNKTKWEDINERLFNFLTIGSIQPKKKKIYWDIFCWMGINKITDNTLTINHIEKMTTEVKGLGHGFLAHMKGFYSDSDNCVEYTDKTFIKGFKKLYGTDNQTMIKKKVSIIINEGYGRIFNGFIFQIAHYG
jgi:hypothetical protein